MSRLGDALIASGVAIIALALYLSYTIYVALSSPGPQSSLQVPAGATPSDAVSALITNISLIIYAQSYILIKVSLLFFFTYTGAKLLSMGITANRQEFEESELRKSRESANPY